MVNEILQCQNGSVPPLSMPVRIRPNCFRRLIEESIVE